MAALKGHLEVMKLLLEHGDNLNLKDAILPFAEEHIKKFLQIEHKRKTREYVILQDLLSINVLRRMSGAKVYIHLSMRQP